MILSENFGSQQAMKLEHLQALAISGLGEVGRDTYGVFPLKGKLLNVRDASNKQVPLVLFCCLMN